MATGKHNDHNMNESNFIQNIIDARRRLALYVYLRQQYEEGHDHFASDEVPHVERALSPADDAAGQSTYDNPNPRKREGIKFRIPQSAQKRRVSHPSPSRNPPTDDKTLVVCRAFDMYTLDDPRMDPRIRHR